MTIDTLDSLFVSSKTRKKIHNPFFSEWNDRILENLRVRKKGMNYYTNGDSELGYECGFHANKHNKLLDSENVVILTHPLYLFISQLDALNSSKRKEAVEYKDKLIDLFNNRAVSDYNIVLFDTWHYYADSTSKLLEDGFIDRAYFTGYGNGSPIDKSYVDFLNGKNLFFGGAYNGQCLSSTLQRLILDVRFKSICGIIDLVLNGPYNNKSIKASNIYYDKDNFMNPDDVITLSDLYTLSK